MEHGQDVPSNRLEEGRMSKDFKPCRICGSVRPDFRTTWGETDILDDFPTGEVRVHFTCRAHLGILHDLMHYAGLPFLTITRIP